MRSKTTYAEKLLDPRWQKKRLEVLQNYDFVCQSCGDGESTLHVHHKMYAKGKEPWEYELNQYTVLCWSCHKQEHDKDFDIFFEVMSRLPIDGPFNKEEIGYLIAGYTGIQLEPQFLLDQFLYKKGKELNKEYWDFLDGVRK